ncbi:MAG: PD-(D/E)XK nuclease family protein [Actinomycetia bacterium]|nr:PD-(D/E)XK nuclease family protein [Actinomycetes bacterium]
MNKSLTPAPLNPAQKAVLEELGAPPAERPEFDPDEIDDLRQGLVNQLTPLASSLDDKGLFLNKRTLNNVFSCEVRFTHEYGNRDFEWSIPMARGSVSHKAIELSLGWRGEPAPLDLVEEAIGRLTQQDHSLGGFLQTLGEADLAELRAESNDRVAKFLEMWPPLERRWSPVVETPIYHNLLDGRITLQARPDLTIGRARGVRAGKVIVDLKSGRPWPEHAGDLRFYALVDTLRIGVPPRLVTSYYLDAARFSSETVTVGTLAAAFTRVVDGARRIVELTVDSEPAAHRAGPRCRFCPLADSCEPGQGWLSEADDWTG